MASGSKGIGGPVFFKMPVKVSDERVLLRASVTTADTVADRASIDTLPELELDVTSLVGSATLSEMAIDVAAEERFLFAQGRSLSGGTLARRHLLHRIELVVKYEK